MRERIRRGEIEHSLIETTIGNLENIKDPSLRIDLIDSLDRRLDTLRGRSVLERVEQDSAARSQERAIPASQVAAMGIMRGRFPDAGEAADYLLED